MSETSSDIEARTEGHRRHLRSVLRGDPGRRLRVVLVGIAILAGVAVANGIVTTSSPSNASRPVAFAGSSATAAVVASPDSESSAWFCTGASGLQGSAVGTLVLTNPTNRAVGATITATPAGASAKSITTTVPAADQIEIVPGQITPGPWVAATVLFDGGGVGVSEVVAGSPGSSMAPCASMTASNWYFAHGSTASSATLTLSLYNPSTTDSVVDVTLVSASEGVIQPPAYQGISVPAGSLVVENVGDHLTSDPSVATEVSTSAGTIVAAELETTPGPSGGSGSSLLLGVPSASPQWDFPQNSDPAGGQLVFHVFNPSDHEVTVTVRIGLPQGEEEPLSLTVPASDVTDLVAEQQTRIPGAGPYSLEFSTSDGSGIVVDREVSGASGAPAPQVGQVHGVPQGASRSLLPAVVAPATGAASLAISNLASAPVAVSVDIAATRAPVAGLDRRLLEPGKTLTVTPQPGSPIGAYPLVVMASGPVAVELDASAGTPGSVVVPALVLG